MGQGQPLPPPDRRVTQVVCMWCGVAAAALQVLEGVVNVDLSHNQLQTGKGVLEHRCGGAGPTATSH